MTPPPGLLAHCHTVKELGDYYPTVFPGEILDDYLEWIKNLGGITHLDTIDINELWFQQDGASCHSTAETLTLLHVRFANRLISFRGNQNLPAKSSDLTPYDFFLRGFVKSQMYERKPYTITDLKEKIQIQSAKRKFDNEIHFVLFKFVSF